MNIDLGELNWLAVIVAALAGYALGAVYFTVLAKPWMAAAKLTAEMLEERKSEVRRAYSTAGLGSLVGAIMLAIIVQAVGASDVVEGLLTGLIVGVAVTAVGQVANYAFEHRGFKLYVIDAGYAVLQMLVGGAILGAWQ